MATHCQGNSVFVCVCVSQRLIHHRHLLLSHISHGTDCACLCVWAAAPTHTGGRQRFIVLPKDGGALNQPRLASLYAGDALHKGSSVSRGQQKIEIYSV